MKPSASKVASKTVARKAGKAAGKSSIGTTPESAAAVAPRVRFRVRVTCGDEIAVGPGKIELLEAIRVQGSITMAAKSLEMSYRRAWLLVDEMNRLLRKPVTTSATGGAHGGGCMLTPEGEELIRLYRSIERRAAESCADEIRQMVRMVAKG